MVLETYGCKEGIPAGIPSMFVFSIAQSSLLIAQNSILQFMAYDLFSRGMLGVLHQNLVGIGIKKPDVSYLFANPNTSQGDQVLGIIKGGNLNLSTAIETQMTRLSKGINLFPQGD